MPKPKPDKFKETVALVCSTKHACLLQQRILSHTGGIEIEASYITVYSYDILVINTRLQFCLALL